MIPLVTLKGRGGTLQRRDATAPHNAHIPADSALPTLTPFNLERGKFYGHNCGSTTQNWGHRRKLFRCFAPDFVPSATNSRRPQWPDPSGPTNKFLPWSHPNVTWVSNLACRIWSLLVKQYECTYGEFKDPPKSWVPRIPPFNGTHGHWTDTARSGTRLPILTFHSNHAPIAYHFWVSY